MFGGDAGLEVIQDCASSGSRLRGGPWLALQGGRQWHAAVAAHRPRDVMRLLEDDVFFFTTFAANAVACGRQGDHRQLRDDSTCRMRLEAAGQKLQDG